MRKFLAVTLASVVMSSGVAAGPCDEAEHGKFLSNVCWLTEELTGGRVTVESVDAGSCVAVVVRPPTFMLSVRETIWFSRADKEYRIRNYQGRQCWSLSGVEVAVTDDAQAGRDGRLDEIEVCSSRRIRRERVEAALDNLYTKFCEPRRSEF